jgi:hypothetical protein
VIPYAAIAAVAWGGLLAMRRNREQIGRRPAGARLAAALTPGIFVLPLHGMFLWFILQPVCIIALILLHAWMYGPMVRRGLPGPYIGLLRWLDGPTKPRG